MKGPELHRAPKDTRDQNAGQFIGDNDDHPKIKFRKGTVLRHTRDVAKIARCIANKEQEHVLIITVDLGLHVLNARIVCIGARETATFCPAVVFKGAIIDGASEIIMVHNHPSGDLTPTKRDKKCMKKLIKGGKLLDIGIIDSVIVYGKKYRSLMEGPRK
jgi:DNA repair protein RadC